MAELIDVANAMFRNRKNWSSISEQDKERFFFIFNRYFSKKYPTKAQLLNIKSVDKTVGMDLWFQFMKDEPYPNWFWSKSPKSQKTDLPEKDFELLKEKMEINKEEDLIYLIENYREIVEQELKFYKTKN